MLKNIMYSILAFLVITFIYNTYIKEDEIVKVNVDHEMKLIEVTYKKDAYRVEADEQKENEEEKKIYFDMAKAFFQKTLMKGNKGVFDRITSNLFLEGDIYGINKDNGWEVEGDELEYSQDMNLFYSRKRMNAYNKEMNLHIAGDYFESDTDMTNMKLEKNVEAYNDVYNIKADRSRYGDVDGILTLNGNIKVKIKEKDESGREISEIDGDFMTVVYDTRNRILVSQGAYEVRYKGFVINATEMQYDENTQIMNAKGNAVIKKDGAVLHIKEAVLNQKTNTLFLKGPLRGNRGEQKFEAKEAYINTETENMDIIGKIVVYDTENRMEADRAYYDKSRDVLEVFGDADKVVYSNLEGELYFDYGEYHSSKQELFIPKDFVYYGRNKGEKFEVEGEKLLYNTESENGSAEKTVMTKGKDRAKAERTRFDMKNSYYYLDGNVLVNYGDYTLTSTNIEIDRLNAFIYLNEPYKIEAKDSGDKAYGAKAVIDENKNEIRAKTRTYMEYNGIYSYGDEVVYNYVNQEGIIGKNLYVYDKENEMKLYGDRGEFKKDEYFNIYGNIKMEREDYRATTDKVFYNIKDSMVYFPDKTFMKSSLKDVKGRVLKGRFDTEKSIFYGDDYIGTSDASRTRSDYINYYLDEERADLRGGVEVEDREMGMLVESEMLSYYQASDYVVSPGDIKITKDNIFLEASSGNSDLKKKTVELKDAILTTTLQDRIEGDQLFGDYIKNEFDFTGNIEGKVYTMNEDQLRSREAVDYQNPFKFKGELAKFYFVEVLKDEFMLTRAEIKEDSTFIYKNMELEGDYLEAQGSTQKVFARGNSVISLEGSNQIRADSIVLNMTTENAKMRNNVVISGVSEDAGGINVKADSADFSNATNKVQLEGNIESYKGQTKFNADEGVYDLVEGTLAGKGNIFVTMDFETYEETEAKRKKEKEDKAKVEAAKNSVDIPKTAESMLEYIILPTKYEDVVIKWESSHDDYIDNEGNISHPERDEADIIVRLRAQYILDNKTEGKDYYIRVEKEDKYSYLKRLVNKQEFIYNIYDNNLGYKVGSEYNLKFVQDEKTIVDSEGGLLTDKITEIKDKKFAVIYYFEDISLEIYYKFVELDGELLVQMAKEEEESVEEHNSTGLGKDI